MERTTEAQLAVMTKSVADTRDVFDLIDGGILKEAEGAAN